MAIGNIDSVSSMLARMTPQQRQQFAMMHHNDPFMVSLAKFVNDVEQEKAQALRGQQAMGQPMMPPVVQQEIAQMAPPQAQPMLPEESGIAQLPAENLQNMADGGIVGYADTGLVADPSGANIGLPYTPQDEETASKGDTFGSALLDVLGLPVNVIRNVTTHGGVSLTPFSDEMRRKKRGGDKAKEKDELTKEAERFAEDVPYAPGGKPAKRAEVSSKPPRLAAAAPATVAPAAIAPATTAATPTAQPAVAAFTPASAEAMGEQARTLASAQNKESEEAYAPFRAMLEKQAAALESRGERNKAEALLQAGLAMMASRSPYAMVGIGEGGMKGLAAYQEAQKQDDAARRALMQSQVSLMQAQRAERSGNMRDAVTLMNQARQEKQFAVSSAQHAEQIKNTREFQQGSLEVQRQQAAAAAAQKDAYARLVDARIKALEAPAKDKAKAMQEWGKLQAKVLDSLKNDTTYLTLKPEQQAAYKQRKLRDEMSMNPFLSQYLFTSTPTGKERTLTEKDDEQD